MISTNINDLSREDLLKVTARDRFVKEQLSQRLGMVIAENAELLGLVQELQAELYGQQQPVVEPPLVEEPSPADDSLDN